ncbi:MAG: bacteriochlorophyll 4-vinyl reductase [Chromatiaceae bacterium]|jgi:divinyl protochlorophyllide a 8-vinyl-reductase
MPNEVIAGARGAVAPLERSGLGIHAGPAADRVGPNAIIQTREALDALCGIARRTAIFEHAGLSGLGDDRLRHLIDVGHVNALNEAIGQRLRPLAAHAVLRCAGELTGAYVLENRIPGPAQRLLKALPGPIAQRLLMKAIAKNAWTFAGQAHVQTGADWILIPANPICQGGRGFSRCEWHVAVFLRLFQTLVGRRVRVSETHCTGRGSEGCRFTVQTD